MRNWFRELRVGRGLSQADVARLVGAKTPMVSQWETGKKTPCLANMMLLARETVLGPAALAEFEAEALAKAERGVA